MQIIRDLSRGCKKGIPGLEESLLEAQIKQLMGTCFVHDLQQHDM